VRRSRSSACKSRTPVGLRFEVEADCRPVHRKERPRSSRRWLAKCGAAQTWPRAAPVLLQRHVKGRGFACLPNCPTATTQERAASSRRWFPAWGCRVCLKWENYRLSPPSRVQCGLSRHPPGMLSLPKPKSRASASDQTASTTTETIGKVTIGATIEAGPVVK
jgi:hypothetical protein